MKVLYVASEAAPFVKTGGLADVAGSLPEALAELNLEVTVVIPKYGQIPWDLVEQMEHVGHFFVDLGWRHQYAGIFSLEKGGVRYLFVDNQYYFHRNSIYGQVDDGERFIFFSKAVVQMMRWLGESFDLIHCNDWHTGLIPLYIRDFAQGDLYYRNIKSVFTIHNLKYQGVFPRDILGEVAGLSDMYAHQEGLGYYDAVNFMKGGIVYADQVTTVSPTYSKEILHTYFGETLEYTLRARTYKLHGIINGIDNNIHNPKTDSLLAANYSSKNLDGKKLCKAELKRLARLSGEDYPIIGVVSRLVAMKGIDLITHIMDELMELPIHMVLIGTGERRYEEAFRYYEEHYPGKFTAFLTFDEAKSHAIYAGSDYLLMPSLKEPCGISQLIAMRYGTLPIVRETGGLKDTVVPYNEYTGEGTGFSFTNINAHELLFTVKKALELARDKKAHRALMIQAMEANHSWNSSSREYKIIYESMMSLFQKI
ncbi:MAG: glycogen synthase GlgA [Tissierellia bacterium]|nr:glycogen synthase GlgA [Tissierellia bacterium]